MLQGVRHFVVRQGIHQRDIVLITPRVCEPQGIRGFDGVSGGEVRGGVQRLLLEDEGVRAAEQRVRDFHLFEIAFPAGFVVAERVDDGVRRGFIGRLRSSELGRTGGHPGRYRDCEAAEQGYRKYELFQT